MSVQYVGPVIILRKLSERQFILMDLEGQILPRIFEFERVKPAFIRTKAGNVTNLAQLKQVLQTGMKLYIITQPDCEPECILK